MKKAVVLVEEQSTEEVTKILVARLGLDGDIQILPHQGKGDLQKSVANKLSYWKSPSPVRFVIAQDNDGGNCLTTKSVLTALAPKSCRFEFKIRIVMNELESWYLSDLSAVERAGLIKKGSAALHAGKARFRKPESLGKQEFHRLVGKRGAIATAREVAPFLNIDSPGSKSFEHFLNALKWSVQSNSP